MASVNPIDYIRHNMSLVKRYSREEKKVIAQYWDMVRWTRRNGKMSENAIVSEFDYWDRFSTQDVIKALKVHISNPKYQMLKENYTRGILRNVAAADEEEHNSSSTGSKKNKFHNFEQRTDKYTKEELENVGRRIYSDAIESMGGYEVVEEKAKKFLEDRKEK